MARFDVFRLTTGDIAIDCQSDLLEHLSTRFTVPLVPPEQLPYAVPGLHPSFDIGGDHLVMATHLAGAIPANALREKLASLGDREYIVQRAIDTLSGSY